VLLCLLASANLFAQQKANLKVPITVLVTDPHIQVVDTWKPIWEAQTGGKINIVLVPYATLEEKMWIEFRTKAGSFDIACIPGTWKGDVMGGGNVVDLGPYMTKFGYPGWNDVMPGSKVLVTWAGKVMALPYDGDNHMTYYRKDALENPEYQAQFKEKYGYDYQLPIASWEEVRDIAEFFMTGTGIMTARWSTASPSSPSRIHRRCGPISTWWLSTPRSPGSRRTSRATSSSTPTPWTRSANPPAGSRR